MKVLQVLHMNGGTSETSYARNSTLQRKAISIAKPILEEAILAMYCKIHPGESLGIADLGCSSGPNTFYALSKIMGIIHRVGCEFQILPAEFRVFLNDLPGNDFNSIFKCLHANFYDKLKEKIGERSGLCFISGVPGSFYGRLFAKKSLHFVHSSYSLMWLSQVPPELDSTNAINKGNIYMAETGPPEVFKAYLEQFKKDFLIFLRSRSEEVVGGGRMVLTLLGRNSADPSSKECCYIWELLAKALRHMVSEGLIREEKLDSFNLPQYTPSPLEVKALVQEEGSYIIHRLETYAVSWDPDQDSFIQRPGSDHPASGEKVAEHMRAVAEPLIKSHFGEDIVDTLFQKYRDIVSDHMKREDAKFINLVISLERK